jgi:xylulokinase
MNYLMGIDIGSTSIKAVVFDLEGNLIAEASRPTPKCCPYPEHPEWTVWMPDQVWSDTAACIREAAARVVDPGQIRAVSVTGFGGDGVPIDENGKWLYPFISWLDPRVEPQSRWWVENVGAWKQFSITGSHVYMYNTGLRLRWMMEHEPEILRRTWKWLLIVDYINYMLSGVAATDYSVASTTLLLDQQRLQWSDEVLGLTGIEGRLLCDLRASGTPLGTVSTSAAQFTGLAEGTPVVQGGHDFLCGAIAAGAFEPGVLLDVTGTWELLVSTTPRPPLTEQVFQSGLMIETHVARGRFSVVGAAVASGMLEWFRNQFGQPEEARAQQGGNPWDYLIEAAAASPPRARGAMFLPHLSGSVCPIRDPRSLGVFAGLSDITQRADLLRAIFEGLSYQFREMKEAMQAGVGGHPRVVVIGGATRNAFWMQNKADVAGVAMEVTELPEATALGAALVAGIGVGLYKNEGDAYERTRKPCRLYEPNPALAAKYDAGYRVYQELYPAMKTINSQLYEARAGGL